VFSELMLLGLTAAGGITVFLIAFIFFFFCLQPHHKKMPYQQPLLAHSQGSIQFIPGVFQGPSRTSDSILKRWTPRFAFFEETASTSASSLGNVAFRNYLNFLSCVGHIFGFLSIPSLFLVLPMESILGNTLEFGQSSLSVNFSPVRSGTSIWILYALTWLYSFIVLSQINRYTKCLKSAVVAEEAQYKEIQSRSIMLTGIPNRERRDGSWIPMLKGNKFKLKTRDVVKAEAQLRDELNRQLADISNEGKKLQGPYTKTIEIIEKTEDEEEKDAVSSLHLVVIQDKIHNLHLYHRRYCDRHEHYEAAVAAKSWPKWYYRWKRNRCERQMFYSKNELAQQDHQYQFAGSAFITFFSKSSVPILLKRGVFSFGMPPFASIGLPVHKAPYRDDIIWNNLHVSRVARHIAFYLICGIAGVLMVAFVTPIAIAQDLSPITKALGQQKAKIHLTDPEYAFLTQYLPVVVILMINSLMVPYFAYCVSILVRPNLKTTQEMVKLKLNLYFSLVTTVMIPLLGLDSLQALFSIPERIPVDQIQILIGSVLLKSSGIFTLRYLLNSALLSSASQLIQFGQLCYTRFLLMFVAVTAEEKRQARKPWVFEWGYMYAWTLTIFHQALIFSICVPLAPPLAMICFKMKYFVDKYNMQYGVFTMTNEFSHLSPTIIRCMIHALALMQFVMSGFFFVQLTSTSDGHDLKDHHPKKIPTTTTTRAPVTTTSLKERGIRTKQERKPLTATTTREPPTTTTRRETTTRTRETTETTISKREKEELKNKKEGEHEDKVVKTPAPDRSSREERDGGGGAGGGRDKEDEGQRKTDIHEEGKEKEDKEGIRDGLPKENKEGGENDKNDNDKTDESNEDMGEDKGDVPPPKKDEDEGNKNDNDEAHESIENKGGDEIDHDESNKKFISDQMIENAQNGDSDATDGGDMNWVSLSAFSRLLREGNSWVSPSSMTFRRRALLHTTKTGHMPFSASDDIRSSSSYLPEAVEAWDGVAASNDDGDDFGHSRGGQISHSISHQPYDYNGFHGVGVGGGETFPLYDRSANRVHTFETTYTASTTEYRLPEYYGNIANAFTFGPFQIAAVPLLISSIILFFWGFWKKRVVTKAMEADVPSFEECYHANPEFAFRYDYSTYQPPYRPPPTLQRAHFLQGLATSGPLLDESMTIVTPVRPRNNRQTQVEAAESSQQRPSHDSVLSVPPSMEQ